ncbi:MAG: hypothetical protein ACTS8S_12480 [Giesbergeria sp.]
MLLDNPLTLALRSIASVVVVAAAPSPLWADMTVTVFGMTKWYAWQRHCHGLVQTPLAA